MRHTSRRTVLAAAIAIGSIGGAVTGAGRSERGMTLVVPAAHASMGVVYHALLGKDAQVTFTSDAPLEFFKGSSNKVVGYVVLKADSATPAIAAGEFRLPLDSFDTGLPMRNEHMRSERWMNAGSHPDVVFTINEFRGATPSGEGDGFKTWAGTLVGAMTIKGAEKPIEIPATVTVWPESALTKGRAPGDLLAIRADYTVRLSDYGIGINDPGMKSGKMTDTINLETRIFLSSVSPEAARPARPKPDAVAPANGNAPAPAPKP